MREVDMQNRNKLMPVAAHNKCVDAGFARSKVANDVFLLLAIVGVIRSCIHIFAADGGAGSIAGIDVDVEGGDGIVFAFALWGGAQLLLAIVQLIVYLRYKNLVPLMYVLLAVEIVLRMLAGWLHPVRFLHVPPGAIANYVVLAVAAVMLLLLLLPARPVESK
jgi:hypothetical protein